MNKDDLTGLTRYLSHFTKQTVSSRKVILVRSCESQGNLAGTITGWMDVPLTQFGQKQAFKLHECLSPDNLKVDSYHSSDLKRCVDTAFYALAFDADRVKQTNQIREIFFGEHEGLHFDNLPASEKARFSDPAFKAVGGESWTDVTKRAKLFMRSLDQGTHLVFTHGGLVTSLLQNHGVTQMPSNGSVLGVNLEEDGSPKDLNFYWEFPYIEEDI